MNFLRTAPTQKQYGCGRTNIAGVSGMNGNDDVIFWKAINERKEKMSVTRLQYSKNLIKYRIIIIQFCLDKWNTKIIFSELIKF